MKTPFLESQMTGHRHPLEDFVTNRESVSCMAERPWNFPGTLFHMDRLDWRFSWANLLRDRDAKPPVQTLLIEADSGVAGAVMQRLLCRALSFDTSKGFCMSAISVASGAMP
jgi:hypothetical protein